MKEMVQDITMKEVRAATILEMIPFGVCQYLFTKVELDLEPLIEFVTRRAL